MLKQKRNNYRMMVDDGAFARFLWARLRAFVPERDSFSGRAANGLNERFRFNRYSRA